MPIEPVPCPFCGEAPLIDRRQAGSGFYMVQCANANCEVRVETNGLERAKAIEIWNRRAPA
ncbi:Lar family restriction alleviation protein [Bradyrhizobium sp. 61]|nr:Lar family restriction alleviation protein [Bradyrhizobium sp. 61]